MSSPSAAMTEGLIPVKRLKDAAWGYCTTCEAFPWISGGLYWGLGQSIWLHRNGTGSEACKIKLYGWKR